MNQWHRLERAYRLLVDVGHALLRAPGEAELVAQICQSAVDVVGYRLAWLGYLEQEPPYRVFPVAQKGYDEGYLALADIHWRDGSRAAGPTGRAARTGEPQVAQDIATAPEYEPWRADALARGYASSAAIPLIDGEILGVLNVYAEEPDAFDERELELLCTVAADLTHGILAARGKHELARLQTGLARRAALSQGARSVMVYAHDMANHLYTVALCLEAADGADDAARKDLLSEAHATVDRASHATRRILAWKGAQPLDSPSLVDRAIRDAEGEIRTLLGSGSTLVLELGAESATVSLPPDALVHLLLNLADNARDAMKSGGTLTIETTLKRLDHPLPARWLGARAGSYVSIRVSDTGPGIPESVGDHVFDPFFTTKGDKGTGIGLAAVYDVVVNDARGAIALDGGPGVGAAFEILLPIVPAA
jgi:signal transduction histidine kinase